MISDFVFPFLTIGLAELGDKTQLAILLLASRTRQHLLLFLGAFVAFLIVDGVAIALGAGVSQLLPVLWLKIISALLFFGFGFFMLFQRVDREGEQMSDDKNPFLASFLLIFLTEWGDKTQIAAGLMATKYHLWMALAGTMAALGVITLMAIYFGKWISTRIEHRVVLRLAGLIFILMGVIIILF